MVLRPPDLRDLGVGALVGDRRRERCSIARLLSRGIQQALWNYGAGGSIGVHARPRLDRRREAGTTPLAPRLVAFGEERDPLLQTDLRQPGGTRHVRDTRLREIGR